jgi:hypothetical protein
LASTSRDDRSPRRRVGRRHGHHRPVARGERRASRARGADGPGWPGGGIPRRGRLRGLQHVAFAVTALVPALAALEARGLRFLGGPGAAAVTELREGEHWLRQVFTEPVWGGFFVELVERHGVTGLHASNIRAMNAAKGLEPAAVAPPAVSAAPALPASS